MLQILTFFFLLLILLLMTERDFSHMPVMRTLIRTHITWDLLFNIDSERNFVRVKCF